MPLAMRAGAREHRDFAGALHSNRAAFKARAAARFDEGRNTDTDEFAAGSRLVAIANKLLVIGYSQRLVERSFVVAGVVFDADPGSIGKLLRANEVFAPDFQTIDAQLLCRLVNQALDVQHGLRPAGAAVGSGGHSVRKDRYNFDVNVLDLIGARRHGH